MADPYRTGPPSVSEIVGWIRTVSENTKKLNVGGPAREHNENIAKIGDWFADEIERRWGKGGSHG